jgi:CRISPR/Cas system-associated exonuclease Cas4 (RecB family)
MKPIYVNKFNYKTLIQDTQDNGIRHYVTPDDQKVPSVTTIIAASKDMTYIDNWRNHIGNEKADQITKESSTIGSHMHDNIERWLKNEDPVSGNNIMRKTAKILSEIVIAKGLNTVTEYYGSEVHLYYENLYAGTCDLIALQNDTIAIIDFKNTRKPKSDEMVSGYKMQLAAYGLAHNHLYGTNINKGIIMMVAREPSCFGEYQEWVLEGSTWDKACYDWCQCLDNYHK